MPRQPDCLEGRSGRALEPGDAHPPLSLSFRAWRNVDGYLVPLVPPGEAVQGAGEDVADRQPDKEEPERLEDGPHRRECTPFRLGLAPGLGPTPDALRSAWRFESSRPHLISLRPV